MKEMRILCNPTSPELKVGIGRVFKERRRNKIIVFSIVFLALGVLLFSTDSLVNLVLGFICVGFAVIMPLVHIITALAAIRDTERQEFVIVLNEKNIVFETKSRFSTDYKWCEAFEDRDVITILAEKSQVYCVPKRCFENSEKLAEFEALLSEKLAERYFKNK